MLRRKSMLVIAYGVKMKDIQAVTGAGMIPVMDFKGEAFKLIKLRSDISARVVSVTYKNIEDAAENLEDRQKCSGENDKEILSSGIRVSK